MLKKLFVHEWKACWRLMAAVNGIVLIITFIGMILFRNDFWRMMESDAYPSTIVGVGMLLYFMLYMISVGALSFVVSLYFYVRFYSNLYTDQGYLMHTLPVTPGQLIWSKAFVGVLWHFISCIVLMFSVVAFMFSMIAGIDGVTVADIWRSIEIDIDEIGLTAVLAILLIILLIVASCFVTIFFGYTAVSIGQLFKKQKILGAIGAYIVIYLVMQFVSSVATIPLMEWFEKMDQLANGPSDWMVIGVLFGVLIVVCLVAAGLYFLNEHIMKYKLNLE